MASVKQQLLRPPAHGIGHASSAAHNTSIACSQRETCDHTLPGRGVLTCSSIRLRLGHTLSPCCCWHWNCWAGAMLASLLARACMHIKVAPSEVHGHPHSHAAHVHRQGL
eukprot:549043-Pelagomonas_calceolata.AAC.1